MIIFKKKKKLYFLKILKMLLSGKVSKLLGKENINLRIENLTLKKKKTTENQDFFDSIGDFFDFKIKLRLIFLKLIFFCKKIENINQTNFASRSNRIPKYGKNEESGVIRGNDHKILRISILLKKYQGFFFQFKKIFIKFSSFLSSISNVFEKTKNFFRDLLISDLVSSINFGHLNFLGGLEISFPNNLSRKIFLRYITQLKQKSYKTKLNGGIFLKFRKQQEIKTFPRRVVTKQYLISSEPDHNEKKRGSEIIQNIKKDWERIFFSQAFLTNSYVPFLKPEILFLEKILEKIQETKKTQNFQLKKCQIKQSFNSIAQRFRVLFRNISKKKRFLAMKILHIIFLDKTNPVQLTKTGINSKLEQNAKKKNYSQNCIHPIRNKEKKVFLNPKNKVFDEIKIKLENISLLNPRKLRRINTELSLSRLFELKKQWKSQYETRQKKIFGFEKKKETCDDFLAREKFLQSKIFSLEKRNLILREKIREKTQNESQIRSKLIEIKSMESDFSEIVRLLKKKKILP